jgi:hypothetical protein
MWVSSKHQHFQAKIIATRWQFIAKVEHMVFRRAHSLGLREFGSSEYKTGSPVRPDPRSDFPQRDAGEEESPFSWSKAVVPR